MISKWPSNNTPVRIGTRGSPLALVQANEVQDRLMAMHGWDSDTFEIVIIRTTGDRIVDRPLSEIGGKGLFTKEIEDALLKGRIDIAVHSLKDMPTEQPNGLALDCFLEREDPRDALISRTVSRLEDLTSGDVVGTSSLRRRAQILYRRPELTTVEFRGNVQTRLQKLEDGVADCTFLAMAGLNRLKMEHVATAALDPEEMLPAIAQGVIAIERRVDDRDAMELLRPIHHFPTDYRVQAERQMLKVLDGSCQTPIAGLAELDGDTLRLRGEVLRPDGSECIQHEMSAPYDVAPELGEEVGHILLEEAGANFFD
jgi:hydroxymethylbilane synthase